MFKALLKKQALSVLSGIFLDKKSGKKRGLGGIIGFSFIFVLLFFSVFMMFLGISDALCGAFVAVGMDWLYFALIGLMGMAVSIVGSAFMSYSALFQAKDNELLMSMPIPPGAILFTRMLSIWIIGLLFIVPVVGASVVQYGITVGFSGKIILFGIILVLFTSFLSLGLCCLLGWLVALLMSKVSNKSITTVVFTLVFLGGYYFVYFKIQSILAQIVSSGERIAGVIKSWIYPVYQYGLASTGDTVALIKYCAICVLVIAVVYWIVSRSFIKIATTNRGAVKKEYKAAPQKAESLGKALLHKELRHFVNSPAYLLNAGLGILLMPVAAVLLIAKKSAVTPLLGLLPDYLVSGGMLALFALAAISFMVTFNPVTAPAVSIEGKTIWITQALPIDLKEFLAAKERMHLLLTCIPAVFPVIAVAVVFEMDAATAVMMGAAVMAFIQFMASLGLALNLKMPVMDWQNETAAVKSSISALICVFGGWVLAVLPAAGIFALRKLGVDASAQTQLIGWIVIYALASRLLHNFIYKKGPEIIRNL